MKTSAIQRLMARCGRSLLAFASPPRQPPGQRRSPTAGVVAVADGGGGGWRPHGRRTLAAGTWAADWGGHMGGRMGRSSRWLLRRWLRRLWLRRLLPWLLWPGRSGLWPRLWRLRLRRIGLRRLWRIRRVWRLWRYGGYGYPGYYSGSGYYDPGYYYGSGYTTGYGVATSPGSTYSYSSAYGSTPLQSGSSAVASTFPMPSLGIDEEAVSDGSGQAIRVVSVHAKLTGAACRPSTGRSDPVRQRVSDADSRQPGLDHQPSSVKQYAQPDRSQGEHRARHQCHRATPLTTAGL